VDIKKYAGIPITDTRTNMKTSTKLIFIQ